VLPTLGVTDRQLTKGEANALSVFIITRTLSSFSKLTGMKTHHRVHVKLGKMNREQITAMLTRGRESARVLQRALILRQLDEGQTGAQVAGDMDVARKTVRAIARRYEDKDWRSGTRPAALAVAEP